MENLLPYITYAVMFATFILYIGLLGFILTGVYHDAELRGINGWMVMALTFFSGTIAGTFIWLLVRPRVKAQLVTV